MRFGLFSLLLGFFLLGESMFAEEASDAEFVGIVRGYLTRKNTPNLLQQIRALTAKHGTVVYQRVLEVAARDLLNDPSVRSRYVWEANVLGESTLYWNTALEEIRNARSRVTMQNTLEGMRCYLERHPNAHRQQRGELSKTLWVWAQKVDGSSRQSSLSYLARDEPDRVRAYIEQELARKLDGRDRSGLLRAYAEIESIPRKMRLDLLKKELAATGNTSQAPLFKRLLTKFLGNTEAKRLVTDKFQLEKYRGKSQDELLQMPVSFELSVGHGFRFFEEKMGLAFQITPEAQEILNVINNARQRELIKPRGIPAMMALTRVLIPAGLICKRQGKKLVILPGKTLGDTTTPVERKLLQGKLTRTITADWKSLRILEALAFVESLVGVSITMVPDARDVLVGKRITGKFDKTPAKEVLSSLLSPQGFHYRIYHGNVQIYRK